MDEQEFVDFYELLQISPHAEIATIQRVYRLLANRYHPDNPETGDTEMFLLLRQAVETLTDAEKRGRYDALLNARRGQPLSVFSLRDFTKGIDGENNRRIGVLCLLYNRRRTDVDSPGVSVLDLEAVMACPREHLMFAIWYLNEKGLVRRDEQSNYIITGEGVDYLESHLPQNRLLYRLLKSVETGQPDKKHAEEEMEADDRSEAEEAQ